MWWRRNKRDRDLDDEIRTHLAMAERDLMEQGRSPEAARAEARRGFGNITHVRDASRALRSWAWIDGGRQDVQYAVRGFRRSPIFTLAAVAALGTAIGFGASLFTAFNTLFLAQWPVRDPARVVHFRVDDLSSYERLAVGTRTLDGVAAQTCKSCRVRVLDRDVRIHAVSPNFFDVLGVPMTRGSGFAGFQTGARAEPPVAVLSYRFWRAAFNADPEIIGKWIYVNETSFQVAGVVDRHFTGTTLDNPPALWVPLSAASALGVPPERLGYPWLVGRLAGEASLASAQAEVNVLLGRSASTAGVPPTATILREATYVPLSKVEEFAGLGLMTLGVLLVLLLACANVGNLLLARAAARVGETATRLSLGASRARLVRQHLTESLALALAACVVGIILAFLLPQLVMHAVATAMERPLDFAVSFTPDVTVVLFACGLAVLSVALFGLKPALISSRLDAMSAMKTQGLTLSPRLGPRRFLLALQVAVSTVLLVSAGLVIRSVESAAAIDLGFDLAGVSEGKLETPASFAESRGQALARIFFDEVQRLDSTGVAAWSQAFGYAAGATISLPKASGAPPIQIPRYSVSPSFFSVMRIPLVAGRTLTPSLPDGVVLSETLAERLWPGQNSIGRVVMVGPDARQVIGVAADADLMGVSWRGEFGHARQAVYDLLTEASLAARVLVRLDRRDQMDALAALSIRVDPQLILGLRPLTSVRDGRMGDARVAAALAGLAGTAALAIATVGIAGVFGYVARQRRREIGIHIALGASSSAILRRVFGSSVRALATGSAAGLLGGALAAPLLRGFVNSTVGPFDAVTYAGVTSVLVLAALGATLLPALAVSRVPPATVLRSD